MKIRKNFLKAVMLLTFCALCCLNVSAKTGSIKVYYLYAGEEDGTYAMDGATIMLSRVASVSSDGTYSFTSSYASCGVTEDKLNSLDLTKKNKRTIEKLSDIKQPSEIWTSTTDANGTVEFTDLPEGLYLVTEDAMEVGGDIFTGAGKLIALPSMDDKSREPSYDVIVHIPADKGTPETPVTPTSTGTPTTSGGTGTSAVQTGDETPLMMMSFLLISAFAVLCAGFGVLRRKQKRTF